MLSEAQTMSSMPLTHSDEPEYAWEVATLFPEQGEWSEREYLDLTDHASRRIEFTDGRLEFLAMPTEVHEAIVRFLFLALYGFVSQRQLGEVYFNGIRLRIRPSKVRLPDIIFLHKDHFHARHNRVWDGADLVMEVVSDDPKDHKRDYEEKLTDYAEAKVAEYWIVDPHRQQVIVQRLDGEHYVVHGAFGRGQQASSVLLEGFGVDVTSLLAVAEDIPE
jgi:Uma2 family endonuclease